VGVKIMNFYLFSKATKVEFPLLERLEEILC